MKNVNLDLICGLVGEDERSWNQTLDTLLSLAPEHVTIYLFSLRPQTSAFVRLKNGRIASPPEEGERVALYLQARRRLIGAGYVQTTPNCFAREKRFEQVHQRNAWSSLPLIGFGNSSYSFFDDWVTQNVRPVTDYKRDVERGRIPVELAFRIDAREAMVRYALLSLKQLRISRPAFRERFGFDLVEVIGTPVHQAVERGLGVLTESEFALTEQGIVYVDDVCRSFYSPAVRNRLESPTVQDEASRHVHLKLLQSLI